MSNGWDQAEGLMKKHATTSSGLFVKLAGHGDKIVGAFVGNPFPREVHWTGERYETCTGEGCAHCKKGDGAKLRVAFNFYVPSQKEVKVIEGSQTWFKDVLKVRDKYGLSKWLFEIERHGEAGDTKTTYTILPEEKITPALLKEIEALRLHDLPKVISGGGDNFDSYDRAGSTEPIDARTASQLVARLKALPREALDAFLAKFGVKQIRTLKAADEKAAQDFVESLEAKHAQPQAGSETEIDPFA